MTGDPKGDVKFLAALLVILLALAAMYAFRTEHTAGSHVTCTRWACVPDEP